VFCLISSESTRNKDVKSVSVRTRIVINTGLLERPPSQIFPSPSTATNGPHSRPPSLQWQELFPMLQLFPMLSKAGTFSNATTFSNAFQGRNFFQCYNFFQCFPRQELFPMLHTSMVSEGGREFENFSKKGIFVVSSGKKQISLLLAPPRKTFRKIHQWLSCKTPFDAHAHNKHVKLHHFRKIFCCITPSGNTVQQHQCAKQAISGGQTVHGVFCQRITKSCQITNNN